MKIFSRIIRLIRINFILMRYNIDEIIFGTHWFYPLRFFIYFNPYYWTSKLSSVELSRGQRIRLAIEELGPIFVKAGQIISTRRDLIPDDIAIELAKLQDRVPPFSGKIAKEIIENALNCKIEDVFAELDTQALASASIAQVHAATLLTGESIVVKVLRPNIHKMIDRDIDLLMTLAKITERYWIQLKPKALVLEVAQTLYDELDLMREGSNASQLRRNFAHSTLLYIPKVFWTYCRTNILVTERIHGIPIHNIETLQKSGVDMRKLAERALEIFFTQVFRDSFFHADLHPGNIFVSVKQPDNPTFIAVDFGIVGSLNHSDQRYLAENMIAFFKRDYQRVSELHIASGWLPPDTRIDQFEGAIRAVSEPMLEQPLRDISFGKLLLQLFQVARRFHINIQPQLILLQKTLLNIEGLCRQLSPEFDVWASSAPQIEKWLKKQIGFKSFIHRIRNTLPSLSQQLPELPNLIYEVLKETKHQQENFRFMQQNPEEKSVLIAKENKMRWSYFLLGVVITTLGFVLVNTLSK